MTLLKICYKANHFQSAHNKTKSLLHFSLFWLILSGFFFVPNSHATPLSLSPAEKKWLAQHPIIQIGVDHHWAPFEYLDTNQKYRGIAADYMQLLSQKLGVTFHPVITNSWSQVIEKTKRGEIDLLPAVTKSAQRLAFLLFSQPYLTFPMVIISRQNEPFPGDLATLQAKRVAVVRNDITREHLSKTYQLQLHLTETVDEALQALTTYTVDAYVGNLASISYALNKLDLNNLQLATPTPYSFSLSMGIRKDWQPLLPILQKALNSISEQERHTIRQAWIHGKPKTSLDLKTLLLALCLFLTLTASFTIALQRKNKRLRQTMKAQDNSEKKYQALFQNNPEACLLLRGQQIIECNLKSLTLFAGNQPTEIIGKQLFDLSPLQQPDGQPSHESIDKQLAQIQAGTQQQLNWQYQRFDDTLFEATVRFTPLQLDNQPYLQATIRDISPQRQLENALTTLTTDSASFNQDFFQKLLQQLTTALGIRYGFIGHLADEASHNIQTIAVWANHQVEKNFSYPLTGTPCDNVFGKEACIYTRDVQNLFPDDPMLVKMDVESYAGVPLFDSDSTPLGLLSILDTKPIDNQLLVHAMLSYFASRAAAALEQQQTRKKCQPAHTFFDHSEEGFIITDANQKILAVNPAFSKITGYPAIEVIGQTPKFLHSGQQTASFYDTLWQSIHTTGCWQGKILNRKKEGQIYPEWLSIRTLKNCQDQLTHYIAVFSDISRYTQAEAQQKMLQKQLHHTQKMESLGHLTGGIAHDFNNLLNIISGYTDLIRHTNTTLQSPDLLTNIQQIDKATKRATGLVAQMLTYSRHEQPEMVPTQLATLLPEEIKLIQAILPSSIEVKTTLANDLPLTLINPTQLQQIVMNLAVNARDAMDGQGILHIQLAWAKGVDTHSPRSRAPITGDWLELSIQDTGSGIDPAIAAEIFSPFFTTKKTGQGTGMGLAVSYGIIKSHGGHLLVTSEPGHGTTFRVLLKPIVSKTTPVRPLKQCLASRRAGNQEAILIVDDEESICTLLGQLLKHCGYQTTTFLDSQAALDQFKADPDHFSLLITDQTMPKLTGLELITALRDLRPQLPVILCSGFSNKIDTEEAKHQAIHYFHKPVDFDKMIQKISQLLNPSHNR